MLFSKNLSIRALEPSDIDLLYQWENNFDVWKVSETIAPISRNTLKKFIESSYLDITQTKQARFIIVLRSDNASIGSMDLFEFDAINQRIGIGILIDEKYRKKHFAKEAINLTLKYCFEILHVHQIYCNIHEDNIISLNLFQQLGFKITGRKEHWYMSNNQWKSECFLQKIK